MDIIKLIAIRASILGIFAVFCIMLFLIVCIFVGIHTRNKIKKAPIHIPAPKFQNKELGELDANKPMCYIYHQYLTLKNPSLCLRNHIDFETKVAINELSLKYNVCLVHPSIIDKDKPYDLAHLVRFIQCNHLPIRRVVSKFETNDSMTTVKEHGPNKLIYFEEVKNV